ncbi:hypothetical protein fugu_013497 [Takifugu bimaculatus]|uniref:Fibroblast growth factor 24 n=1 Tax=Takifugu bimaculatus TaxID=433685 RepID=A0A4Z2C3E3_9TELE|nr:hypothetical protein fugu_013497 [Takifugu bimaculatus]
MALLEQKIPIMLVINLLKSEEQELREAQQSSADFRFYIENHTKNPDELSRKQVRIYQLYSRTTGKHVQILGKNINANGDDGGKYALLVVETETFGSHIRIKGKESDHYICMNKKGKIVGRDPILSTGIRHHGDKTARERASKRERERERASEVAACR